MDINRSNYEIWLTDLIDGNLSASEAQKVSLFLEANPDINDEFNELQFFFLKNTNDSFKGKNELKKSSTQLPTSQFDYLCAAWLENDLDEQSQSELQEALDNDPEHRKTFELFQKTRLLPVATVFKNKNKLIKRTPFQKVVWLTVTGLSSAVAIALIIFTLQAINRRLYEERITEAQLVQVGNNYRKPYLAIIVGQVFRANSAATDKNAVSLRTIKKPVKEPSQSETLSAYADLTKKQDTITLSIQSVTIHLTADIGLKPELTSDLAKYRQPSVIPEGNYEMSNVEKFFARILREKILKEKEPKETPLKGYEVAEAGVAGLNKLFGWEMALNEKTDENGEVNSVHFTSKLLKFNAPVKKTVSAQ